MAQCLIDVVPKVGLSPPRERRTGGSKGRCPAVFTRGTLPFMTVMFVDGWYGPEPQDWQSVWCERLPVTARVEQDDWG
jgi:Serine hydrolase